MHTLNIAYTANLNNSLEHRDIQNSNMTVSILTPGGRRDHPKRLGSRGKYKLKQNRFAKKKKSRLDRPRAPHNTTQFLSSMYRKYRQVEPTNRYEGFIHDFDLDEICVTGGSMRGIFNTNNPLGCFPFNKDSMNCEPINELGLNDITEEVMN
jgi:hypothetical protein